MTFCIASRDWRTAEELSTCMPPVIESGASGCSESCTMSPLRQNALNACASCSGVTAMPWPKLTEVRARVLLLHSSFIGMRPRDSFSTPTWVLTPKRQASRQRFISSLPMRNATVAMPALTDFTSTCSQLLVP